MFCTPITRLLDYGRGYSSGWWWVSTFYIDHFSVIDKEKEGDCALPPEEGEGLQEVMAGCPSELPPPLHKTLKISDLRR